MAKKLAILGAAVMTAAAAVVPVEAGAVDGAVVTETFEFTGDTQTFTVPDGVTEVDVVACGAQGGAGVLFSGDPVGSGGLGGLAFARLGVTAARIRPSAALLHRRVGEWARRHSRSGGASSSLPRASSCFCRRLRATVYMARQIAPVAGSDSLVGSHLTESYR